MSAWQPCGRRLRECIDDVCRSMGTCAWPPETPAGLDTSGKRDGTADSVSSEVMAVPSRAATANPRGAPASVRCFGAAGNCTEPPAYAWTGPHGGEYLLCVRHCAEWRVQVAATPLEPTHIGEMMP